MAKKRPIKRLSKKAAKAPRPKTKSAKKSKPRVNARLKTAKRKSAKKSVAKWPALDKSAAKPKPARSVKKPRQPPISQRAQLGAKQVGEPIWELKAATAAVLAEPEFRGVRAEAIEYYFEKFLMRWLPESLDEVLSDADLAKLAPETVRGASYLLLGDMIRKLNRRLMPDAADQAGWWKEKLLVKLAKAADVPAESYVVWVLEIKDADDDATGLIERVAKSLGLAPHTLFMFHTMMIEVVEEDVLDAK